MVRCVQQGAAAQEVGRGGEGVAGRDREGARGKQAAAGCLQHEEPHEKVVTLPMTLSVTPCFIRQKRKEIT